MELEIETYERGGEVVIVPEGEIDMYTSPTLREELLNVVQPGPPVVLVDLRKVEFIDSTGLGVLLGILKRQKAVGGQMELVVDDSQSSIIKLLNITGLDDVFTIRPGLAVER